MYIREEQARECLISSYDRGLMAKNDKKKKLRPPAQFHSMAITVVEFSREEYKIKKVSG